MWITDDLGRKREINAGVNGLYDVEMRRGNNQARCAICDEPIAGEAINPNDGTGDCFCLPCTAEECDQHDGAPGTIARSKAWLSGRITHVANGIAYLDNGTQEIYHA